MQSQSYVTFQTRLCVMLVLVASLMWVAVSAFILYNPLIPDFVDLSRVSGTVTLCTQLCSLLSLLVFVTGEVTANVSSVDRLWSLVPSLYTGLTWARHGGSRLALMTLVSSVWSLRLTWNFWRRGGYSWPPWTGCEDYRLRVCDRNQTSLRFSFKVGICSQMACSKHKSRMEPVQSDFHQLLSELPPHGDRLPCLDRGCDS